MSANDQDTIRIDEFLYLYYLRHSKAPSYQVFKPQNKSSRLIFDSPSSLHNWKMSFFFIFGKGWKIIPSENLEDAPKLLRSQGVPMSGASLYIYMCVNLRVLPCECDFDSSLVFLCRESLSLTEEMVSCLLGEGQRVLGNY